MVVRASRPCHLLVNHCVGWSKATASTGGPIKLNCCRQRVDEIDHVGAGLESAVMTTGLARIDFQKRTVANSKCRIRGSDMPPYAVQSTPRNRLVAQQRGAGLKRSRSGSQQSRSVSQVKCAVSSGSRSGSQRSGRVWKLRGPVSKRGGADSKPALRAVNRGPGAATPVPGGVNLRPGAAKRGRADDSLDRPAVQTEAQSAGDAQTNAHVAQAQGTFEASGTVTFAMKEGIRRFATLDEALAHLRELIMKEIADPRGPIYGSYGLSFDHAILTPEARACAMERCSIRLGIKSTRPKSAAECEAASSGLKPIHERPDPVRNLPLLRACRPGRSAPPSPTRHASVARPPASKVRPAPSRDRRENR